MERHGGQKQEEAPLPTSHCSPPKKMNKQNTNKRTEEGMGEDGKRDK
jgi:hypothetical protein